MTVDVPQCSFVVLERRASHGGTWDLMKYPGIRSDSDMYSFGYNFFVRRPPQLLAKKEELSSDEFSLDL